MDHRLYILSLSIYSLSLYISLYISLSLYIYIYIYIYICIHTHNQGGSLFPPGPHRGGAPPRAAAVEEEEVVAGPLPNIVCFCLCHFVLVHVYVLSLCFCCLLFVLRFFWRDLSNTTFELSNQSFDNRCLVQHDNW